VTQPQGRFVSSYWKALCRKSGAIVSGSRVLRSCGAAVALLTLLQHSVIAPLFATKELSNSSRRIALRLCHFELLRSDSPDPFAPIVAERASSPEELPRDEAPRTRGF